MEINERGLQMGIAPSKRTNGEEHVAPRGVADGGCLFRTYQTYATCDGDSANCVTQCKSQTSGDNSVEFRRKSAVAVAYPTLPRGGPRAVGNMESC